jgi:hypothetical protein
MKTRKVWGWVVNWSDHPTLGVTEPNVTVDLFFSSKRKFKQLTGYSLADETLVPIRVPMDFEYLDFVPDNY